MRAGLILSASPELTHPLGPSAFLFCSRAVAAASELLQIRALPRGSLANLASQPLDASAAARLQPHEVLVAVKAVGINFRCCWLSECVMLGPVAGCVPLLVAPAAAHLLASAAAHLAERLMHLQICMIPALARSP